MLIIESFGKNIFIGDQLVGYIKDNALYIKGKPFASITDDGVISYENQEIGFVDEDNSIIIRGEEVGYIDLDNNFRFYKGKLK